MQRMGFYPHKLARPLSLLSPGLTSGTVASAWMLHEMASRNKVPLAIVFNTVNPILVQGY